VPRFATATVTEVLSERKGLQRVGLDTDRKAYVLTDLIGPVSPGDRVVVNTTAVDLGLGTGGWDVVHWNLSRDTWDHPGPGHVLKLRYTSLQADTGVAEEAPDFTTEGSLRSRPVVACFLHSQVACVATAFKQAAPGRRLAYIMTDTAALPLALSDTVAELRADGTLDLTVTAGQAFGGDREAVNVASALLVAAADADAVVVGPGPGVVGTHTKLGFSGLDVATTLDLARTLGGLPVVALRYSDADPRSRHRGISHHAITALELVRTEALVPVPAGEPTVELHQHHVQHYEVPPLATSATTMGRGPDEDPGFFAYAGAAGVAAALSVVSTG
jgi:hypothetical protein